MKLLLSFGLPVFILSGFDAKQLNYGIKYYNKEFTISLYQNLLFRSITNLCLLDKNV